MQQRHPNKKFVTSPLRIKRKEFMKKTVCFVSVLLLIWVICSCGSAEYVFDTEKAGKEISQIYLNDKTVEITALGEDEASLRYGLAGLYDKLICGVSVTITSDEYLVAEAKDAESAKAIRDKLDEYRKERIDLFASYAQDQVPKLENAVLKCEGKYVFFAVAENSSTAENIWNSNLRKK